MINYWAPRNGLFTIGEYSKQRGRAIAHLFTVHDYHALPSSISVAGPAHIFSASDQLSPAGKDLVGCLYDAVAAESPDWRLLNDPRCALMRQQFLHAMSAAGLNDFHIHAATSDDASIRFPVFLRERNQHDGPLTGLLDSPVAVRRALRGLRLRGHRTRELIQVEYQDTSDAEGRFRKYSAFRVGDNIVRTHMMISSSWSVKSNSNKATVESATEERDYLCGQMHENWLRTVFDLANIQWGRIDYGVMHGKPQAWEINTNPTIGRRLAAGPRKDAPEVIAIKEEGRQHAHARLRDAFVALEHPASYADTVHISLPPTLLRQVQKEQAAALRREQHVARMRTMFHSSPIAWPARYLLRTIAPRQ